METLQSNKVKLQDQVVRKGQNYLIGNDIFLNVIELQSNRVGRGGPVDV